jgi:GPH family glycoside/pentoside/hexuronide:cation symporter
MKARLSEKIGYGFGDMSSSMFWKIFTYYLPFFYSNVFGLTLGEAAALLLITKLWDAIFDPIMGIIADRTKTRYGKYRPYLLWIAIPFAVMGVLTFTTPAFPHGWKLFYAYATYILMMTVYSAINVPYGAMLGVVTDDGQQRTVFSSFRMFFAYGGSFIAVAIFEPIRNLFGGINSTSAWQLTMIVIGIICAVLFYCCFRMTRENVKPVQKKESSSVSKDLWALVTNGPWWILLVAAIAALLFNSIRGGVAAYFFKDYVGSTNSLGGSLLLSCGIFLAVGEISNMIGVVLAVPISKVLGKKNTYILAMIGSGVLSIVFYYIPLTVSGCWILLLLQVVISAFAGLTFPLLWSMYADVADYSELKNGSSSIGLIFSSSSMAQKFGAAFGSALILWLLAAFNYNTGVNVHQAASALSGLNLMMSWIPAAGCAIAAVAVVFYPLSEKKMKAIAGELNERRMQEGEEK